MIWKMRPKLSHIDMNVAYITLMPRIQNYADNLGTKHQLKNFGFCALVDLAGAVLKRDIGITNAPKRYDVV